MYLIGFTGSLGDIKKERTIQATGKPFPLIWKQYFAYGRSENPFL